MRQSTKVHSPGRRSLPGGLRHEAPTRQHLTRLHSGYEAQKSLVLRYARLTGRYWRDAAHPRDFLRVMRVRLSQSKLGPVVCPQPINVAVHLRSMGGRVWLRSHTTDISVLGELVVSDGYLPVLSALSGAPATIVDLGANTGLTARWFLRHWPQARIAAVEPEPGNLAELRTNVAPVSEQVVVIPAAVGASERTAVLHTTSGEYGFTMVGEPPEGAGIEVPVVTMLSVLDQSGIDRIGLLKSDIEGAEQELFADCATWVDRVDAMVIECHGDYHLADLLDDLERAGAHFRVVDHDVKTQFGFEVGVLVRE